MPNELIKDLVSIAIKYGSQFEWIQGSGGNCSVKDETKQTMYVKASGSNLPDMSPTYGFVQIANEPIRKCIEENQDLALDPTNQQIENTVNEAIDAHTTEVCEGFKTASIETGMHAVLGRYVFHAHHIYSNLLLCSQDSEQLLLECNLPEPICLVEIVPPGFHLSVAVLKAVQGYEKEYGFPPKVIYLKNHGIVFQAESLDGLIESIESTHELIQAKVSSLLGDNGLKMDSAIGLTDAQATSDIFPDTVVFRQFLGDVFGGKMPSAKERGIKEIFNVAAILENGIEQCGLQAEVLPPKICNYILEMDREKHRQKVGAQK